MTPLASVFLTASLICASGWVTSHAKYRSFRRLFRAERRLRVRWEAECVGQATLATAFRTLWLSFAAADLKRRGEEAARLNSTLRIATVSQELSEEPPGPFSVLKLNGGLGENGVVEDGEGV